jgi:hypothetical protein
MWSCNIYEITELNATKGEVKATIGPIKVCHRVNSNRYKALADWIFVDWRRRGKHLRKGERDSVVLGMFVSESHTMTVAAVALD